MIKLAALGMAAFVIVGACGVPQPLPTVEAFNGSCRGVGFDGHITGSPADPRLAWLVGNGGRRRDIIWPPGYTARFSPGLEILDEKGDIAFRDGDAVSGGCTTGLDAEGPLLIAKGF